MLAYNDTSDWKKFPRLGAGKGLNPVLEELSLKQIDLADERFRISSPWGPLSELKESVRQVGILTPLRVQPGTANRGFRLISGFRRCAVAAELQIERAFAIVRPASADEKELIAEAIYEAGAGRPLTEIEKARTASKLVLQFGFAREVAMEKFLGFLGIRPDPYHLNRLLQLAALPLRLQKACDGALDCDLALRLAKWPETSSGGFADLVDSLRLGRNKQRELFGLMDDLAALRGSSPAQLWEEAAGRPLGARNMTMEKCQQIRDRLYSLRFPVLSAYQERSRALRSELSIPPEIQISLPENLEGSEMKLRLRVSSPAELKRLSDLLKELAEAEAFKAIFKLL